MCTAAMPTAAMNPDQAWAAVLARDAAADFFYAVATTGVFCRPGCPSRRPVRTNVRFFPDAASALRAGFRECLRCRPLEAAPHADAQLVEFLAPVLRRDRPVTLAELARRAASRSSGPGKPSASGIQRAFQRVLGVTPAQYQRQMRATRFRRELAAGSLRITDTVYAAGYSGPGRAYENAQLGMPPSAFRRGGKGARIGYATAACPLGRLLIGATERGLCAVILGDTDAELVAGLRGQFSAAEIYRDRGLRPLLDQVLSHFTPHPAALDLNLDLRATAFQMRVWEALRRIPRGETRSYAQVATSLGQPRAVRAVARACGANPVAVVVPCHRVIASDGALSGYRWGMNRKRQLLEMEKGLNRGKNL